MFSRKFGVLFVCTENICRSPVAEGLLRHYARLDGADHGIRVGSAGTRASQPGARPDPRAVRIAAANGVRLGNIRARRVTADDLARHDLLIAVDRANALSLEELCPPESRYKISLLLSHDPEQTLEDVPDPYYGSYQRFIEIYQIIDKAVIQLHRKIVEGWRN